MKGYKMDFTAEVEFVRDALYSTGGGFFAMPAKAITTAELPPSQNYWEQYANLIQGNRRACRGDRLMLEGSLEFSLKESGWQSGDASMAVSMDSANRKGNCLARNSSQASAGATSAPSAGSSQPTASRVLGEWTFALNLENETVRTQRVKLTENGIEKSETDFSGSRQTTVTFEQVSAPIACDRADLLFIQARGGDLMVSVNQYVDADRERLRGACQQIVEAYSRWKRRFEPR